MPTHNLNDTHIGSISIYLDSSKADVVMNGTKNSNVIFYLENIIKCPPDTHILMGMTACQIPVSFYNIHNDNNTLTLLGSINGSTTIALSPQNYNTETLVSAINTQLLTAGNDIQVSFNESSYKFTFSSNTQTVQITATKLNKELGIPSNALPTLPSSSFTCPSLVNLSGTDSVYVMINNLSIESLDSRAGGDLNGVLGKIDVRTGFGNYIDFQQTDALYYLIADTTINHFNVSLTDTNIDLLDMNGISWSVSLCVHFSKKRLPTMVNDYLLDEPKERENEIVEKALAAKSQKAKNKKQKA